MLMVLTVGSCRFHNHRFSQHPRLIESEFGSEGESKGPGSGVGGSCVVTRSGEKFTRRGTSKLAAGERSVFWTGKAFSWVFKRHKTTRDPLSLFG